MTYFVYLIGNYKRSKLTTYVGFTNNLSKRINLHNNNKGAKFTKGRNWKLMYYEKFHKKKEAILREYYIKKNRKFRNSIKDKYK
tara:strand:- start:3543 stop:3794 length:252 start_codon:yes stop_codon:yes gene_type:complete